MSAPVLVTRPVESALPLVRALREAGCGARTVPTVAQVPVDPTSALRPALAELGAADWLVVTSAYGAAVVARELKRSGRSAATRIAAIGRTTERALVERGLPVRALATEARPAALVAAMEAHGPLVGADVLLARSDAAADDVPEALAAAGATVRDIVAYRTVVAPASSRRPLVRALADPSTHIVVFASGSAVRGALVLAGPVAPRLRDLQAVTIGPSTSAAARHAGLRVAAEAARPDLEHLVVAVLQVAPRP